MSSGEPSPLDIHRCLQLILLKGEQDGTWWPCLVSSSFHFLEKVCNKVNYPLSTAAWTASFTSLCVSGYEENGGRVALLLGNPPTDRFVWENPPMVWNTLSFDRCIQCSPARNPLYFQAVGEAKSFLLPPEQLFGMPALDNRRLATSHPHSNKRQKVGHHENGQPYQHNNYKQELKQLERQQLQVQVLEEQQKLSLLKEQQLCKEKGLKQLEEEQQSKKQELKHLKEQQQSQEQVLKQLEGHKEQLSLSEEDLKQRLLEHQHNQQRVLKHLEELEQQQQSKEQVLKQLEKRVLEEEKKLSSLERHQHTHQGMVEKLQELQQQLEVEQQDKQQVLEQLEEQKKKLALKQVVQESLEQQQHNHQGMVKRLQELQQRLEVEQQDKEQVLEQLEEQKKKLASSEEALKQTVQESLEQHLHTHQGMVKQLQELQQQLEVEQQDKEQVLEQLEQQKKKLALSEEALKQRVLEEQKMRSSLKEQEHLHLGLVQQLQELEKQQQSKKRVLKQPEEQQRSKVRELEKQRQSKQQMLRQLGEPVLEKQNNKTERTLSVGQEPDTMERPRLPMSLTSPGGLGTPFYGEETQVTPAPVSVKTSCSTVAKVPARVSLSPPPMIESAIGQPLPPPDDPNEPSAKRHVKMNPTAATQRLEECCASLTLDNKFHPMQMYDNSEYSRNLQRVVHFLENISRRNFKHEDTTTPTKLYISGPTGTGKTFGVKYCLSCLPELQSTNSSWIVCEVDQGNSGKSQGILNAIYQDLNTRKKGNNNVSLEAIKKSLKRGTKKVLLVVDEAEQWLAGTSGATKRGLFELANDPNIPFALICISNSSLDSVHYEEAERVRFCSYSDSEIYGILQTRVGNVFHNDAIGFIAKKVALQSGNIREAINMALSAAQKCLEQIPGMETTDQGGPLVFVRHVAGGIRDERPTHRNLVAGLPLFSKFTLFVLHTLRGEECGHCATLGRLHRIVAECCSEFQQEEDMMNFEEFIVIISTLVDMGILQLLDPRSADVVLDLVRDTCALKTERVWLQLDQDESRKAIEHDISENYPCAYRALKQEALSMALDIKQAEKDSS